jgi:multidrug efflux pump subunit AcrA (membrane-fusion protein)
MNIRSAIHLQRFALAVGLALFGMATPTRPIAQGAALPAHQPFLSPQILCGSGRSPSRSSPTAWLRPISDPRVRARVDGQIEQVLVQEGQMVRKGQPMFVLDSRLNRALLAQLNRSRPRPSPSDPLPG